MYVIQELYVHSFFQVTLFYTIRIRSFKRKIQNSIAVTSFGSFNWKISSLEYTWNFPFMLYYEWLCIKHCSQLTLTKSQLAGQQPKNQTGQVQTPNKSSKYFGWSLQNRNCGNHWVCIWIKYKICWQYLELPLFCIFAE